MKSRLLIIAVLCFVWSCINSAQGQSSLIFKLHDDSEQIRNLSGIKKITFSNGDLVLETSDNQQESFSLPAIVNVVFSTTTSGIESDFADSESLGIYPNPATSFLYVKNAPAGKSDILIFTIDGRMVLRTHITSSEQPVDISRLIPGFYMIKINSWVFKFKKS